MLLGAIELGGHAGRSWLRGARPRAPPAARRAATPYGPVETARYYHLLLVDPPFAELVTEWQWSDPGLEHARLLRPRPRALVVLGRRRVTAFDVGTLVLTFVGAVTAIRGIPWFALACLVLLPIAIGRALATRPARRGARTRSLSPPSASPRSSRSSRSPRARRPGTRGAGRWKSPQPSDRGDPTIACTPRRETATGCSGRSRAPRPDRLRHALRDLRPRDLPRIVRFRGERGDDWKSSPRAPTSSSSRRGRATSHVPSSSRSRARACSTATPASRVTASAATCARSRRGARARGATRRDRHRQRRADERQPVWNVVPFWSSPIRT